MKTTARDRWLMACLPAIATMTLYFWVYGRDAGRTLGEIRASAARANESTPPLATLSEKQDLVEDLSDQLDSEKVRAATLASAGAAPLSNARSGGRSAALVQISNVLSANGMALVKSGNAQLDGTASPGSEEVLQFCKLRGLPAPQFWRLSVLGTYAGMRAALKALQNEAFVIPVMIEMVPAEQSLQNADENIQAWTLTVWI